jgi:hypothetical protein
MKKKLFLSVFCFCMALICDGQAPQAFKYQAVIRDTTGSVIADHLVSLKISIIKGEINGDLVYSEIHDIKTNSLGLVNLEIGRGLALQGDFSQISWGEDNHFIQLEIDMEGAMDYKLLGTSQLLSVPYALYAEKSGTDPVIDTVESQWKDANGGIYYDEGNVGINQSDPQYTLDLNGVMNIQGDGKISNSFQVGTDKFTVTPSGYVGLGTSDPASNLQIEGMSDGQEGRNFLWLKNNSTDEFSDVDLKLSSGDDSYTTLTHRGDYYTLYGDEWRTTAVLWNNGKGLVLRTSKPGIMYFEFYDGVTRFETARFTGDGKVGIGTKDPQRALHVNDVMRLEPRSTPPENPAEGDIYMDSSDHRLKVFDGELWQSCW